MPTKELRLFPDPGRLPSKPSPKPGSKILVRVGGFPPFKQIRQSLRNPSHPNHDRFVALREAATKAMGGRAWSDGPIELNLTMYGPGFEKGRALSDYVAGTHDTLDGSHGVHFTYLPIVYQDDCQVWKGGARLIRSEDTRYVVEVQF